MNDESNVNYQFFIHLITRLPNAENLNVLDYGCGQGTVVQMLRRAGIDCYGVEVCYEGASFDAFRNHPLYQEGYLREIPESGDVPFEDGFFDVIISNQVFEHVKDKATVLQNLERILKDDGFMWHHFPSREVLREGHIGIPLAHWMPKGRLRYVYTAFLRSLGFGYHKNNRTVPDWTQFQLHWIDKYCWYEKYQPLHRMMAENFVVTHHEIDYCRFRARNKPIVRELLHIEPLTGFYEHLFRSVGFMAVELRKRQR
jgi:SAM-dependent methyltransferase